MIELVCQDATDWLEKHDDVGSVFTSLPDSNEINFTISDWENWFLNSAMSCMIANSSGTPCIFYQTDRKYGSTWISKADILMDAAHRVGLNLIWHKIVLRREVGKIDLYRPGYSHLMAFGGVEVKSGKPTPDVIPVGEFLWNYGMNMNATRVGLEFIKRFTNRVCDPFCGKGTVLHMALGMGMDGIGVDIDRARIEETRKNISKNFQNVLV